MVKFVQAVWGKKTENFSTRLNFPVSSWCLITLATTAHEVYKSGGMIKYGALTLKVYQVCFVSQTVKH